MMLKNKKNKTNKIMNQKSVKVVNLLTHLFKLKLNNKEKLFTYTISKILNILVILLLAIKIIAFKLFMILDQPIYGLIQLNVKMLVVLIINNMMVKNQILTNM